MYCKLLLAIVLVSPISVFAQRPNNQIETDLVRNTVGMIAGTGKKNSEIVLNDLREFKGKIIAMDEDQFFLQLRKKKELKVTINIIGGNQNRPPVVAIKYRDVLQIQGKNAVVSFVPDPKASPYSTWDEVESIGRGEFVQVHRSTGGTIHGVFYRSTSDSLSLMTGNKETVVSAADITRVYRVKGDTRRLITKIVTGGTLGAEISEKDWLPIIDPRGCTHPIPCAFASGIGATLFLLSIGRTERVLVFAR